MATVLNARPDALVFLGMKCSSFSAVNRGTSGRSIICGLGNLSYRSVQEANLMLCRTLDSKVILLELIREGAWEYETSCFHVILLVKVFSVFSVCIYI